MISRDSIEKIKDATAIYDVVSEFVELKRKGSTYMGCCPFHSERKPSFSVNPARNICKCFSCGKGGDAIFFLMESQNMAYNDALMWLAKRYHIDVTFDKKERTQEEIEASKEKESMQYALSAVQEFFIEQFKADNPEAASARDYAYARWPVLGNDDEGKTDIVVDFGIGYAPKSSQTFFDFAKKRCLSNDLLLKLGILKDGERGRYTMFRDRLTIPIRDRWGHVIGFTARYMGERDDVSKYINSSESPLYKKSEHLFGIDTAAKWARRSNDFILVEGAPDVIRLQSIGFYNAVAPLGTALTEHQLKLLRRFGKILRIIPDSDPPKGNGDFSAGIAAALRSGTLAMKCGFEVYVREIPRTEEDDAKKVKHDPDTYIKSPDDYDAIEDVPFLVWLARKRFSLAKTHDVKREVVQEVAELFPLIEDKSLAELCLEQLNKLYDKPLVWKRSIKEVAQKATESIIEENKDFSEREKSLMRKHGIVVMHNMYYCPTSDGELVRISNFILRPIFHVKHKDRSLRAFRMVNEYGQEEPLELSQRAFTSVQAFQAAVEGLGSFVWLAKQDKLNKLKEYLFSATESAENIDVLGWNEKGDFFAFADGIYANGQFKPIDDVGIVQHGGRNYYLPAFSSMYSADKGVFGFERKYKYRNGNKDTLFQFVQRTVRVFGDGAKVAFAWFVACAFRDYIYQQKDWFPLLNLFGITGSGKTSLATVLASLFCYVKDPDKLGNTSVPAMSYMFSHARNGVVILDEYTNLVSARIIDMLKAIWGGTTNSKMNMAEGAQGMISSPVFSGVIFCGQHLPTADPALFNRCIHLAFAKTTRTIDDDLAYEELKAVSQLGNAHLGMEIMGQRKTFVSNFDECFELTKKEVKNRLGTEKIHVRTLNNWVAVLAAFRAIETSISVPFSYAELFEICLKGMRHQEMKSNETSETADFWNMLDSLRIVGKVLDGTHFVIKRQRCFVPLNKDKEKEPARYDFGGDRALFYLNWSAVQPLITHRTVAQAMKMDVSAILNYLRTCDYFLGTKQQRYTQLLPNGTPDYTYETKDGKQVKYKKTVRSYAMVFDYDALKSATGIDFETFITRDGELDPDDNEPSIVDAPTQQPTLFKDEEEPLPF